MARIDEALAAAKNGDKIFVEPGTYDVTSLFLFDKTVTLIGASVKRCVLSHWDKEATPISTVWRRTISGTASGPSTARRPARLVERVHWVNT